MVCRTTPGNSALTTFARLRSGVDDVQVLSMFHEQRSGAPATATTPSDRERREFLAGVRERVMADQSLTEARRNSICQRLTAAEDQPLDARSYYAWRTIEERAVRARGALDTHFREIADRHGTDPADVQTVFRQIADRNREAGRDAPEGPANLSFDDAGLPTDRATRFAMEALYRRGTAVTNPGILAQAQAAWQMDDRDEAHEQQVRRDMAEAERRRERRAARRRLTEQSLAAEADGAGGGNQCASCGQFAGDGHTCAPTVAADVPAVGYAAMARDAGVVPAATAAPDRGAMGSTPSLPVPEGHRTLGLIEARDRMAATAHQVDGETHYRTTDGNVFRSQIRAIQHERATQFAPVTEQPPSIASIARGIQRSDGEFFTSDGRAHATLASATQHERALLNCPGCGQFQGSSHTCDPAARDAHQAAQDASPTGQWLNSLSEDVPDQSFRTVSAQPEYTYVGRANGLDENGREGYEDAERAAAIGGEEVDGEPMPDNPRLRALLNSDTPWSDSEPESTPRLTSDEALADLRRQLSGDSTPPAPAPAPSAAPVRQRQRTALRTYTAENGTGSVRMNNVSQIRAALRSAPTATEAVTVTVTEQSAAYGSQSFRVTGDVEITNTGRRRSVNRDRYEVANASERSLRCTCPQYRANYDCSHLRAAREQVQATLNDRDPVATAPSEAVSEVRSALHGDYQDSLNAQQQAREDFADTSDGVSYVDNMEAFQSAWDEAKARMEAGDNRLPYMTGENVTNGLGARNGGRSFGIEIEIDFPDDMHYEAKHRVAREIYEAGLSQHRQVLGWHHFGQGRRGGEYTDAPNNWTVQFDRSVDGLDGARGCEIVSPILYDEPHTWENIAKVCEIVERNGGRATPRTGLHVNVGAADFNHTVETHNRLLRLSESYEDVIVRCAHNPESGPRHRGRAYCQPNEVPASGYRSIRSAQVNNGHRSLVNLDHVPAEGMPITSSTRVEVRVFDGTVDPGRMQTDVKMALAMVNAATRGAEPNPVSERAGTHRSRNMGSNGRMRRLSGDAWQQDTESVRRLADTLYSRDADKRQMIGAFAASRWQAQ